MRKLFASCAIIALSAHAAAAQAQASGEAAAAQAPDTSEGEIVVTARKRDERAIDTPTSISVFGAADLENRQIRGVEGIANAVPSLFYQQRGGLSTAMTIRGVGGDPRSVGLESGVSVAVDGATLGRTNAFNTDLFEIAQIEVLRGPQGTVFGTNTIGGLINITSVKPSDEVKGGLSLQYGNYSSFRGSANISGPLTDTLYAGISGSAWQGGNYIYNETRDKKMQGHDRGGGRVALRWLPTPELEANLAVDYTRDNQDYALQQFIAPFIGPAATNPPKDRFTINFNAPAISNMETYGANLNLAYTLPGATITSITTARKTSTLVYSDGDSSPQELVRSGPFTDASRLFTQELRISSLGKHQFEYVAGLYFQHQSAKAFRHIALNGSYDNGADTDARIRTNSYAVFANFDYHLTDALSVTGGARYNIEDKQGSYVQVRPNFPTLSFNFENLSRNDKQASFLAGLKYKITPFLSSYATVSTGKKSGGFNVDLLGSPASTPQTIAFKPESLTSYEAGLKGEFFDRKLSLSASVFHLVYKDRQVSSYIAPEGVLPYITITNAGRSVTDGFEIEGSLRLPEDLRLSASFAHMDAKYTSFPNATASGGSYTGNPTEFTPDYTATFGVDKTFEIGSGSIVAHADTSYQGDTYLDPSQNRQNFQSAYWLVNGRVGYEFNLRGDGPLLGIYAYAKNLTNKAYLVFARQASGANTGLYGEPRIYGVELRMKF